MMTLNGTRCVKHSNASRPALTQQSCTSNVYEDVTVRLPVTADNADVFVTFTCSHSSIFIHTIKVLHFTLALVLCFARSTLSLFNQGLPFNGLDYSKRLVLLISPVPTKTCVLVCQFVCMSKIYVLCFLWVSSNSTAILYTK